MLQNECRTGQSQRGKGEVRLLRRGVLRLPRVHQGSGVNTAMLWMEPWQVKRLRLERAAGPAARPVSWPTVAPFR